MPGRELAEDGGLDRGDGVDVDVREPLESRELGVVDAPGAASFAAVVNFGGEDFGQVGQVRLSFPVGDLGQPGAAPVRTVGRCSSRAAAPIEAWAAASTVDAFATV